jgi:hypothetical protein
MMKIFLLLTNPKIDKWSERVSECENLENFFILMPKAALGISLAPFFQ